MILTISKFRIGKEEGIYIYYLYIVDYLDLYHIVKFLCTTGKTTIWEKIIR